MNADRTPPLPGWLPWLVMGLFLTAAIWVVVVHEVEQRDLPITLFAGVSPANYPAWAALVDDDGALTEAGRAIEGALG